tara:strand:- start:1095 stop:2030 length:936 start_codon:yes stop_codon:yes gene_type:complete
LATTTTTATLIEVISKFRGNLQSLKACLKPVVNEEYTLLSVGHAPLSNEIIKAIFNAEKISEVQGFIDQVVSLKISREAEFLRFVLITVIVGMAELLKDEGYRFEDQDLSLKQAVLTRSMLEGNLEFFEQQFQRELRKGYSENNEQRAALDAFSLKLSSFVQCFIFNFHMVKTGVLPGMSHSEEDAQRLKDSISLDITREKIASIAENPLSYFSKKKHYKTVDSYLGQVRSELVDHVGMTSEALEYIISKMTTMYKNKAKFQKNDIFDFFILFALHLPNTRLVTLDKKFLSLLKSTDAKSYALCEELGFVS